MVVTNLFSESRINLVNTMKLAGHEAVDVYTMLETVDDASDELLAVVSFDIFTALLMRRRRSIELHEVPPMVRAAQRVTEEMQALFAGAMRDR